VTAADGAVVCDASVLAPIVYGEPLAAQALALTRRRRLLAPTLLRYEMAQVAAGKCARRPDESPRVALAFAESLRVPVRLLTPSWPAVLQLARENALSAYDASYLQVALSLRVPLATLDARLAEVADAFDLLAAPGDA